MINTQSKTKYLNNKDLLKEIHLSKSSYCSFLKPGDETYDLIVSNKKDIDDSAIAKAQKNRASRIEKETKEKIDPNTIGLSDLVFRVMTWDHIPKSTIVKKTKKNALANFMKEVEMDHDDPDEDEVTELAKVAKRTQHIKVNFPPFVHYRLTKSKNLKMVGKSHWLGDFKTGSFSKQHGQITDNLARMIIKLCERYSSRSNWRGYSYSDEMRGQAILQLSTVILQFDESKSNNPFSYATSIVHNSFLRILNIEKRNQNVRDDLLEKHGLSPSFSRQNQQFDEF